MLYSPFTQTANIESCTTGWYIHLRRSCRVKSR